jgi:four helix bundle protein
MYIYSFEKLEVWNESKEFTKSIYTLTSKFPDSEKFGLVSQLRRASVSICSNIAEGSARKSFKDKAHFTTMAFSSTVEVLNQLILSFELDFIKEKDYLKLRQDIESVTNKLNGLRNYQIDKSIENSK